jgi:hypothetical protein
MKKLFVALAVLLGLVVIGVGIFVATFDLDRYRPMVVEQMQKALGKPVSIERLSLGWRGGAAVLMRGLTVRADAAADAPPVIQVDTVSAVARLLPLLRRKVEIVSVVILRPQVHVLRDAQGRINLTGAAVAASPAAAPSQAKSQAPAHAEAKVQTEQASRRAPPVDLHIERFTVEDGSLRWTDAMTQPPTDVTIDQLEAVLTDVTAEHFGFKARAAAFAPAPNVTVQGRCTLPSGGTLGALEQVRLETDLSQWRLDMLQRALPALANQPALTQQSLAGRLLVTMERLPFDPAQLADAAAAVQFEGGRLVVPSLAVPLEGVALQATVRANRLEITQAGATLAGGTIGATGSIAPLTGVPQLHLRVTVERLPLGQIVVAQQPEAPHLRGVLSASFDGTALGLAGPQLLSSVSGAGRVQLQDGVIENLNILRLVLDQLSLLPGLSQRIEAKLPESYQQKLSERDTRLLPLDQPVTVTNGELALPDLRAGTEMVDVNGTLTTSLVQPAFSDAVTLSIEPQLSEALVRSVDQFQGLVNANGRIEIPATVQWPRNPPLLPDVQYVAQRLITTQVQESLGDLLRKTLEREGLLNEPSAQPTQPSPAPSGP